MDLRTKIVAAATAAVPVVAAAQPAGAATQQGTLTFTNGSGQTVECIYNATSHWHEFTEDGPSGEAYIQVYVPGGADRACDADLRLVARWSDRGAAREADVQSSDASSAHWFQGGGVDEGSLYVTHRIRFDDCSADCEWEFQTHPK